LNEHVGEPRRRSVDRVVAFIGVRKGRVRGVTSVRKGRCRRVHVEAAVVTKDQAIGPHENGDPV
jgi:hypothetical protein